MHGWDVWNAVAEENTNLIVTINVLKPPPGCIM